MRAGIRDARMQGIVNCRAYSVPRLEMPIRTTGLVDIRESGSSVGVGKLRIGNAAIGALRGLCDDGGMMT
jgi:hypothetical protein